MFTFGVQLKYELRYSIKLRDSKIEINCGWREELICFSSEFIKCEDKTKSIRISACRFTPGVHEFRLPGLQDDQTLYSKT